MKTITPSIPFFSGYPLHHPKTGKEEELSFCTAGKEKKNESTSGNVPKSIGDIPANWDESWFANYE